MPDAPIPCTTTEDWLLAGAPDDGGPGREHLASCPGCRAQWQAHRLLVEAYAAEPVPDPAAGFAARLDRRLGLPAGAPTAPRPLRGWRRAALWGYALASGAILAWLLARAPLPEIHSASPWLLLAVLAAVPVSLIFSVAAAGWLPARGPRPARGRVLSIV